MFAGFSTVGFCGSRSLVGSAAAQVCTLASVAARSETAVLQAPLTQATKTVSVDGD